MNSSWRKVFNFQAAKKGFNSEIIFVGAQGICDAGSGDGGLPDMLASFLPLVPDHHLDEQVGDHEVRFDDYEDRFDGLKVVNEIECVSNSF